MEKLFKNPLDLEVRTIFLDPDCRLVVLNVSNSESSFSRLATVSFPTGADQGDQI